MPVFGRSDADLKRMQEELEKREGKVKSDEASLVHEKGMYEEAKARFEQERADFRKEVDGREKTLARREAEIESSRAELLQLEAKAKNGFVKSQREAFKEVIEKRARQLDAREKELSELQERLTEEMGKLYSLQKELTDRELAVTEREQKADSGFADKVRALVDENKRQHTANVDEAARLEQLGDALSGERTAFETAKAELAGREREIRAAEQRRDAGYSDERDALAQELRELRARCDSEIAQTRAAKFVAIEEEVRDLRETRLKEVDEAEKRQRERVRREIEDEQTHWARQRDEGHRKADAERLELSIKEGALAALRDELEKKRAEYEGNEKTLERRENRLEQLTKKRADELDDAVEARLEERRKSLEIERDSLRDENDRLRGSLQLQMDLVASFDQLKRQLGDEDPHKVLAELNSKADEIKRLREDLANRPTEETRERCKELESDRKKKTALVADLQKKLIAYEGSVAETADLRFRISLLDTEKTIFSQKAKLFEGQANEAAAELSRLRAAYDRAPDEEARYTEIRMPVIKDARRVEKTSNADGIDEQAWLKGIAEACGNYGLHFNPRILKAFHTALKTAEWSPLTVLAGVSGTGKSELPRLYSHFGGLLFEPLSVQPNWDSQESMLGFFNSIDNKFDAQPVLRFLAQSQERWTEKEGDKEGYPGMSDAVCLILLDEMNLAHPELYFAEFLSKLELRRGKKGTEVPSLLVKIGAGMKPYSLPLGRNVLWTGTMNQDETTKSLSDKVLDRSIIIHFPRPTELRRRLELKPLDDKNRSLALTALKDWRSGTLLHKDTWNLWLAKSSKDFSEEDIKPYKTFIEEINAALEVVGRAIGHRVWQSVEYYMANYPDVRAAQKSEDKEALGKALHTAFEDQLVQKVMPKLRGIDTRGKSRDKCLEKIRAQINIGIGGIPFSLAEDFDLACDLGYGQFIWQSANYLKDEPVSEQEPAEECLREQPVSELKPAAPPEESQEGTVKAPPKKRKK